MALRHTISPQLSNRKSPPVTRSVSRNAIRHPTDTSTPITRRSMQPGMHIETVERVFESADDTDIDLNSSKFIYNEHFSVKEMTYMKKEMWYDWLEYRVRMLKRRFCPTFESICKTLFFVVFIAMLSKYGKDCVNAYFHPPQMDIIHHTDSDNAWMIELQKMDDSVSSLQANFNDINKRQNILENRINELEHEMIQSKGFKKSVVEELEQMNSWKAEMSALVEALKQDLEEKKSSKIINTEEKPSVDPTPPPIPTFQLEPIRSINRSPMGVNVANSLIGASIDNSCSSRAVSAKDGIFYDVMSYFGSFKEGYVLLDREVLSPGEAWCTYDKKATLTVKLARYITPTAPIAVSYQHVRWSGIVPNHAPKLYDLVACLDLCCTKSEPLVTDCEYKASDDGHDEQEQFCYVPKIDITSPINHVQFRFRENHGNMTKTCAYLVRVYGEPVAVPKEEPDDNGTSPIPEPTLGNPIPESV